MNENVAYVALLYLLPAIIGFCRNHRQRFAIAILNVLLGWTVLGWIVALIWSATNSAPPVVVQPANDR